MKKLIIIILVTLVISIWTLSNFEVFTWLKVDSANVLISSLAFCGLMIGLFFQQNELELQREELKLQRNELKETRKEFELQNRTLRLQRFDDTFFNLLNLYFDTKNGIHISLKNIPIYKIEKLEPIKLKQVDEIFIDNVKGEIFFKKVDKLLHIFEENDFSNNSSSYNSVYSGITSHFYNETIQYYRVVTTIFKTIDDSELNDGEKKYYLELFSDFMSLEEFRWLYFYSMYNFIEQNPLKNVFSRNKYLLRRVNIGVITYDHLF